MIQFFGRWHPLLVHLPIGLLVLLAFLELLSRSPRFKGANSNAGIILALAVPLSVFTAFLGWLLSLAGGYDERLLQLHKWTGIATAAACLLVALLYRLDLKKLYRFSLAGTFLVLVVASHFGGSLTHGSDYLTRYAPEPLRHLLGGPKEKPPVTQPKPQDFAQLKAFNDVIEPALQKNCVQCHGPEKSKGKLRMDSLDALLKGGSSGSDVVPGKAAESEMVRRLKLPQTDEDHMPPDGKPQPSQDEIALLQWWIDAGAPGDKLVTELKPPASIKRIIQARLGIMAPIVKATPPKPLADVTPIASNLVQKLNVSLGTISAKESWLQCNASILGTNFGDTELSQLTALGPNLRWLDLAGTRVTDAGLSNLTAMPNLIRLHLERTGITDAGLASVTDLANLEYLDLYGTPVTDAGVERLQEMPRLKQLYLWQTEVTTNGAKAFLEARTDTNQLQKWREEIEQLQAKINDSRISVELGTVTTTATSTNAAPINKDCPVSGKPVDAAKTAAYEGSLVAFCCDDCKAEFEKDPKKFLGKLGLAGPKESDTKAGK
jgi:YHS domain-containing protein